MSFSVYGATPSIFKLFIDESMDVVMERRFCVASFQLFCLLCKFLAKYRLILEQTIRSQLPLQY